MDNYLQNPLLITIATTLLVVSLIALGIILVYLHHKRKIKNEQEISQLKIEHEKRQLQLQLEIQEATFKNISREIHDNISLSLTLAKLNLNTLKLDNNEISDSKIEESVELISTAINDLSDLSKGLNSETIAQQGFIRAIQTEIERIKKIKKFKVNLEIRGWSKFLDSTKELMLYRITQEAFNNIIKHSKADTIELRLCYNSNSVNLCINDNGTGINWDALREKQLSETTSGINNMRNRAEIINGEFDIQSTPNKGTSILINVPF